VEDQQISGLNLPALVKRGYAVWQSNWCALSCYEEIQTATFWNMVLHWCCL